jgi:uncharacterized membrane protein YhhN
MPPVNSSAWLFLALFLAVAAMDWVAVHLRSKRLEYAAKPGCMLFLIAAALVLDPVDTSARVALVAALVLSLVGDVFLMLPGREQGSSGPNLFVAGLAAFLAAHVAYVVGFGLEGIDLDGLVRGLLPVGIIIATVGRSVVASVEASSEPEMAVPVAAYVTVISTMVLFSFGTGDLRTELGALLFALSDSLIAWGRFRRPTPWGPMAVIVTYHLAQALLLLGFT